MTASSRTSVGLLGFGMARAVGVVGALFSIAGGLFGLLSLFFPSLSLVLLLNLVLSFVGSFIILISLYYFSKLYGNPSIYTYYLYSLVLSIVAAVVYFFGYVILGSSPFDSPEEVEEWLYRVGRAEDSGALAAQALTALFYAFLSLLLFALLYLVAAFFYYRALTFMAASSQVELFRYAGLLGLVGVGLIFVGALLLIILIGVLFIILGYLLLFISPILLLFAFLEIREPQPSPPTQPMAPAAPA